MKMTTNRCQRIPTGEKWELERTNQCKNCPWKVNSNPFEIPGYDPVMHAGLADTIADPDNVDLMALTKPLRAMSCHDEEEAYCVGWLYNQLNQGNNVALRVRMSHCTNASKLRVFGEQHETFEDTIPTRKE
jgi:hypothetical protein